MGQASTIGTSMLMDIARLDNAFMRRFFAGNNSSANKPSQIRQTHACGSGAIAALKQGNLFAPMTFVGSCNRDLFEIWLEECLLPKLQPGDVIVIDNASFHRSQTIDEIVAEAGCEVWYLPAYSPDLNKIEHWWFMLKNWMRQRWDEFGSFRNCVDAAFKYCPNVFP